MKYILLIVLLLGVVSAEDFGAGETVQLYFEDVNFDSSDVQLYYNFTSLVDVNPIVKEDVNILYFDLPVDCSLGVYYLDYSVGNLTFNVVESESVMRISPVYYVFEKDKSSFYLELTSVRGSFDVNINGTNVEPRKSLLSLDSGETKKLYVDYENVSSDGSLELSYGNLSYSVRLFYLEEMIEEEQDVSVVIVEENITEVVVEKVPLTFLVTKPEVNLSLVYNQSTLGTLKVQNTFGEPLQGLSYKLSGNISGIVSYNEEVVDLAVDEIYAFNFVFNEDENVSIGNYYGEIIFGNEDYEIKIPVAVYVNDVIVETTEDTEYVFSDEDIIFEGDLLEEEEGNGLLIIGIILIVLMVFFIGVVVLKLRQKQEKKFSEYIEETKKK